MNRQIGWSNESNLLHQISIQLAKLTGVIASVPPPSTGTVTSVAQTVPTGFTISGSPITSDGTLAIDYDTGYSGFGSNSVTEVKLSPQYKGSSAISALDVDWSASFAYTKTLTGNTVFTFSNLYIGIKTLIITGNFTVGFPTGFTLTNGSEAYDGTKVNLIEVICWDTVTPTGLVNITYSV